jgi:Tfp pilus assembly ATPase PilU
LELCQAGVISEEDALRNADSQNNLRLKLKLASDPAPDHTAPSFKLQD